MSYTRDPDRPQRIVELLDALSDTPVTSETHAWFIGRTRNASVLEQRLAALVPDAQLITRSDGLAAWASRRHSATIVYWPDDGRFDLTLDDDLEMAITVILNDIAPPRASARPAADDLQESSGDRPESKRYGGVVSDPVIKRVAAIEDLPPGSPATRRLIAEWSDGSQSEALAWFSDLCGHPHKSSYAEIRVMPSNPGSRRGRRRPARNIGITPPDGRSPRSRWRLPSTHCGRRGGGTRWCQRQPSSGPVV